MNFSSVFFQKQDMKVENFSGHISKTSLEIQSNN
jgi:hypothetical protein